MSIGCVAIAGRPQDVVSSSGALWGHQTAETARGREWCIRYRITRLRNSVLSIANAPTGESSVLLCSPVRSVSTSGTVEIEASPDQGNLGVTLRNHSNGRAYVHWDSVAVHCGGFCCYLHTRASRNYDRSDGGLAVRVTWVPMHENVPAPERRSDPAYLRRLGFRSFEAAPSRSG